MLNNFRFYRRWRGGSWYRYREGYRYTDIETPKEVSYWTRKFMGTYRLIGEEHY
jgi:hypothetical protein